MVFFASIPSKPGNPQLPAPSLTGWPEVSFTQGLPPVTAGSTYFVPNSPWYPVYPPGSSGSGSLLAFVLPAHLLDAVWAQWMAIPTKSVVRRAAGSAASGEVGP